MKKLTLALVIGMVTLSLYACDDALTESGVVTQSALSGEQVSESGGFLFPEGTTAWIVEDEGEKSFIRYVLPETHRLLAKVADNVPGLAGQVLRTPGGDITCTCTAGTGSCDPFCASGGGREICGCIMDGCTTCVGEQSRMMDTDRGMTRVPFQETAIVDLNAGISVAMADDLELLRCPSSVLFEDEEILASLQAYVGRYQRTNVEEARRARPDALPDNYSMVPLNVYGNLVWVPFEKNLSTSAFFSALTMSAAAAREGSAWDWRTPGGGGGSCSCSSGGGGCEYGSGCLPLIGCAEWCTSDGCNGCTLHN